jgi:hypothetical protein
MPRSRYEHLVGADEILQIYRDPVPAPSSRGDSKFDSVRMFRRDDVVAPLAAPRARIRVAALLQ